MTAWDNDSTASVVLDMPIIQSATLGAYSFPSSAHNTPPSLHSLLLESAMPR
nr:hypothetical protein KXZ65_20435 [Pectobacterium sp. PL152]